MNTKPFAVQNETEGKSLLSSGLDQAENSGKIGNHQNNSEAVTPQATTMAIQADERTPIGLIAEGPINSLVRQILKVSNLRLIIRLRCYW